MRSARCTDLHRGVFDYFSDYNSFKKCTNGLINQKTGLHTSGFSDDFLTSKVKPNFLDRSRTDSKNHSGAKGDTCTTEMSSSRSAETKIP